MGETQSAADHGEGGVGLNGRLEGVTVGRGDKVTGGVDEGEGAILVLRHEDHGVAATGADLGGRGDGGEGVDAAGLVEDAVIGRAEASGGLGVGDGLAEAAKADAGGAEARRGRRRVWDRDGRPPRSRGGPERAEFSIR